MPPSALINSVSHGLSTPLTENADSSSPSAPSTPQWLPHHRPVTAVIEASPFLLTPRPPQPGSPSLPPTVASADVNAAVNVPQTASSHSTETAGSIAYDVVCHMLPSLCSPHPIRRSFARNLDLALRASVCFAVAAVLSVQSWSVHVLGVSYLLPVLCTAMIRPTVGNTIQGIDVQGKGVLLGMLLDVVIILTRVGSLGLTSRTIAVEVLLFFSTALLGYVYNPPAGRRFTLALHALVMIEVAFGVAYWYLPLQILASFAISYALCLLLTVVPLTRIAKDELLDRYQQALQSAADRCSTCWWHAYLETGPVDAPRASAPPCSRS